MGDTVGGGGQAKFDSSYVAKLIGKKNKPNADTSREKQASARASSNRAKLSGGGFGNSTTTGRSKLGG